MGLLKILNKLSIKKDNKKLVKIEQDDFSDIPKEIIELLWFKDGLYKNYEIKKNNEEEIYIGDIKITISASYNSEPSLISIKDIIQKPKNNDIEPPGYYPSYSSLNPNQRWEYLNWLKNIDSEIDISYVFIFYYGLERHLFLGDYTSTWNMICRLRKYHKNRSFISYSTDALIASCIVHNRPDLFIELLQNTEDINDILVSDLYLLAKYKLCGDITPKEIMSISSNVGFKNNRYIKNDELVFENELTNMVFKKFNKNGVDLSRFDINKSPKKLTTIMANYSMNEKQRYVEIPSLTENEDFRKCMFELLSEAHESTKSRLKEIRKLGSYVPTIKKSNNIKEKKTPDKIYDESILFDQVDTSIFDKNEEFYNNYICPYCKEKVNKMPVSKGKCSQCKSDILIKNSIFTDEKVALTIEENKTMTEIRNERIHRNYINKIISMEQLNVNKIKKLVDTKGITIEGALIIEIEKIATKNKLASDLGLYRCSIMHIGSINEHIGNLDEALKLYMLVCYYDLNGASNSGLRFDGSDIFLAPGVIKGINKIIKKLKLSEDEVHNEFKKVISEHKENGMFMNGDIAWKCMKKALYEDILVNGTLKDIMKQIQV